MFWRFQANLSEARSRWGDKSGSDGILRETWESFVKLPRDATWTMEQVSSELYVHGSTPVGWHLQAAPKLSVGVHSIRGQHW